MCFGKSNRKTPKWQQEEINSYKFEFVDIPSFVDKSCGARWSYFVLFLLVLRATLIYIADAWTIVNLALYANGSTKAKTSATQKDGTTTGGTSIYDDVKEMPIQYLRFIFWASILASYVLLVVEIRKSRRIIKLGDIALTYTNVMSYRYMSLVSYGHFCFFRQITMFQKGKDRLAFFVFFTLRSWKRFLFAESPRQIINGVTLVFLFIKVADETKPKSNEHIIVSFFKQFKNQMGTDAVKWISFSTVAFTFVLYVISAITFIAAALIYIPLVLDIDGNVKEYCCHKIDKRLETILKVNNQKARNKEMRKMAKQHQGSIGRNAGNGSTGHGGRSGGGTTYPPNGHSNGGAFEKSMAPTLPNVGFDDEVEYGGPSMAGTTADASFVQHHQQHQYYSQQQQQQQNNPYDDAVSFVSLKPPPVPGGHYRDDSGSQYSFDGASHYSGNVAAGLGISRPTTPGLSIHNGVTGANHAESRARMLAGKKAGPTLPTIDPSWMDEPLSSATSPVHQPGSAGSEPSRIGTSTPLPFQQTHLGAAVFSSAISPVSDSFAQDSQGGGLHQRTGTPASLNQQLRSMQPQHSQASQFSDDGRYGGGYGHSYSKSTSSATSDGVPVFHPVHLSNSPPPPQLHHPQPHPAQQAHHLRSPFEDDADDTPDRYKRTGGAGGRRR